MNSPSAGRAACKCALAAFATAATITGPSSAVHVPFARAQTAVRSSLPFVPDGWRVGGPSSGGTLTLTPPTLSTSDVFIVDVGPELALHGVPLRDWMQKRMAQDAPGMGTLVKPDANKVPTRKPGQAIVLCGRTFKPASSLHVPPGVATIGILYFAVERPGDRVRLVRLVSNENLSPVQRGYFQSLTRVVNALSDSANNADAGGNSVPKLPPAAPVDEWEQKRRAYTKPGKGVKPSELVGVFIEENQPTEIGNYIPTQDPILVFKDGTYYDDLNVPPGDFDANAARKLRPLAWHKWRKSASGYELQARAGNWAKADWRGPFPPAPPGQKLSGAFGTLSTSGNTASGGGTLIASTQNLSFSPNGQFKAGRFTSVSSAEPTQNTQTSAQTGSRASGTYQIVDGYTLVLKWADGHTDRRSFVFMNPTKPGGSFFLNGAPYLKKNQ